ncbi:WD40 repeat domain-containing protein [Argonema galeatum]|uniref:WD40 repeat domain-containing protein n=1 Tax=Argonema galeatum TaxID=2942762 RepID=UPI002011DE99
MAWSPDGKVIATASSDGTVKLWNSQGILLRTLTGHTGVVRKAAFSPNLPLETGFLEETRFLRCTSSNCKPL